MRGGVAARAEIHRDDELGVRYVLNEFASRTFGNVFEHDFIGLIRQQGTDTRPLQGDGFTADVVGSAVCREQQVRCCIGRRGGRGGCRSGGDPFAKRDLDGGAGNDDIAGQAVILTDDVGGDAVIQRDAEERIGVGDQVIIGAAGFQCRLLTG